MRSSRLPLLIALPLAILSVVLPVTGQECSETKKCATGCCSRFGFCGTSDEHCGAGCLSTCDFRLGCDAQNPCKDGTCCSKFGFCGIGQDYCSPENCTPGTNCTAKAQCDPGGLGSDYVELSKCPLNVCCSKWGYCGTTQEFCGDKKVVRPSCDVNLNSVNRVVGYYEGWAARRSCQAFMPENVPTGVYTHLNFAFASIDPSTFQVVPADQGDVALYSRLTALKKKDPNLKVFIAIGGWAFNDPGPTASVFSALAADPALQKVFFSSLISFMSTYNFDGVDIDWEYPGADDRSGRASDFANFPSLVKNLKAALLSSGGRSGLSVTLPVSYWYLQHFDIARLELWVDFFNIMSYDLHGLWDKDNKWLGPFLNSHTNLTEIEEYMDLFWRNGISPTKLNLGLAFYSRTFIASSTSCLDPACTFDSVGPAGPCSRDDIGGSLTNAELTDQISKAGVTSRLDKAAAVKITAIRRNWITYDDRDTWQLKIDWARQFCFGGVMVWAVSQDYPADGTFSKQLQEVTQYTSPSVQTIRNTAGDDIQEPTSLILRNQCYWSNCGAVCDSGYSTVPRLDTDRSGSNDVMLDGSNCRGGQLRTFCCPSSEVIPKCGWFDFNNGNCGKNSGSVCPAGGQSIIGSTTAEVATLSNACHTRNPQVACCETFNGPQGQLTSVAGYDMCVWDGRVPDCGVSRYYGPNVQLDDYCDTNGPRNKYQVQSNAGSGAAICTTTLITGYRSDDRALCCKPSTGDIQWRNCNWVPPHRASDGWCEAYCPAGTVRLAMEFERDGDPDQCRNGGAHAYCCEPVFRTQANDEETHAGYVASLKKVMEAGCDWPDSPSDIIQIRLAQDVQGRSTGDGRASLSSRDGTPHNFASDYDCQLAKAGLLVMVASTAVSLVKKYEADWDDAAQYEHLYHIPSDSVNSIVGVDAHNLRPDGRDAFVEGILNSVQLLNESNETEVCDWYWNLNGGPVLGIDPDDGGHDDIWPYSSSDLDLWTKRSVPAFAQADHQEKDLERRDQTGARRTFNVHSSRLPTWVGEVLESEPYPNGNHGDDLQQANNDNSRYKVESSGCGPTDYVLNRYSARTALSPKSEWVTEHILELQTIPRFIQALVDGTLPSITTNTKHQPQVPFLPPLDEDKGDLLMDPFAEFRSMTGGDLSAADLALVMCGSTMETLGLVVAHEKLNGNKTKIFGLERPVDPDKWAACCLLPTRSSVEDAFSRIQQVMGVFDYYDDVNVKNRHQTAFNNVVRVMYDFDVAYHTKFPGFSLDIANRFGSYYRLHMGRMQQFAKNWVTDRLEELNVLWVREARQASLQAALGNPAALPRLQDCLAVLGLVGDYLDAITSGSRVQLDLTIFV